MPREMRSGAAWLACAKQEEVDSFLEGLSENALLALPWMFEFWALPHQLPPEGGWKSWVIMGGRGAGKTRACAEWVRAQVEGPRPLDAGRANRVALAQLLVQRHRLQQRGAAGDGEDAGLAHRTLDRHALAGEFLDEHADLRFLQVALGILAGEFGLKLDMVMRVATDVACATRPCADIV